LNSCSTALEFIARAIAQEKEINAIKIGKHEVTSLPTNDMILDVQNLKKLPKLLE
jgi:hypothetical protein